MAPSVPPYMRAAQFDNYGRPGDIVVRQVPTPTPAAGQVLVAVHATSVNGGELLFLRGALRPVSGRRFPKGLGIDLAGTLAAVGEGVVGLVAGQRVWGLLPSLRTVRSQAPTAAAAEYAVVDREQVHPLPDGLDPADAAALPVVGPTALWAVRPRAPGRAAVEAMTDYLGDVGRALTRCVGVALSRRCRIPEDCARGADGAYGRALVCRTDRGSAGRRPSRHVRCARGRRPRVRGDEGRR